MKDLVYVIVVAPFFGSLYLYLPERTCLDDIRELTMCLRAGSTVYAYATHCSPSGQPVAMLWEGKSTGEYLGR